MKLAKTLVIGLATAVVSFAPVLSPAEAAAHPHNVARGTFVEANGRMVPAPAPRFSRTPTIAGHSSHPGTSTDQARRGNLWSPDPE